ncbi:hypothetical protein L1049_016220 [Liquidambar formosana]|uniref:Transmembrane protein n=1 Tax=Liquidambar formosana TaxID=63359 RepID=A0AAP0S619_LIQFO
MDHMVQRDRDFMVDLESGTTSEEDGSIKGEDGIPLCCDVLNSGGFPAEHVKVVIDKNLEGEDTLDLGEKKKTKEKRKKNSNKKPPKPPRPPRGPSLDAADQKLIREISELAMLKRARTERMKALKKMKAAKASSSNSNLFALVFTIFFCLVIAFQGMSCRRNSPISFHGSPESAAGRGGSFISVQYYQNISASDTNGPNSASPNLVEAVSGSDPQEKVSRVSI